MSTTVRFITEEPGQLTVLIIETNGTGGLIAPLVEVLALRRFEVTRLESRLVGSVRVERLNVAEAGEQSLSPERRALVQEVVFGVIQTASLHPQLRRPYRPTPAHPESPVPPSEVARAS